MNHVLIIGVTGGIGQALVRQLFVTDPECRLTVVARPSPRLTTLGASYPALTVIPADCTTESGADQVSQALSGLPPLDGMVHLIGNLRLKPLQRMSFADWRESISVHLDSAFLALRLAVRRSLDVRHPLSAVLMSSVAANLGLPNHEAVAAAKAGIEGLVRSAAATYADKGIRINAVAPGLTETPLTVGLVANEAIRKAVVAQHPLGRLGTAEDQAAAIAWLLSPSSSWITGQVLGVDGGMSRVRGRS